MTCHCIDDLVYLGKGEAVFWASFIQVSVIYINPPLTIGFLDRKHVRTPLQIAHFSDKVSGEQLLYFLINGPEPLRVKSPFLLNHWFMLRVHAQSVAHHCRVDPGHALV